VPGIYQRPPAHHPTKLAPKYDGVCIRHTSNCTRYKSLRFVSVEESSKASERRLGSTCYPNRRHPGSPEPRPPSETTVPSNPNVKCTSTDLNPLRRVRDSLKQIVGTSNDFEIFRVMRIGAKQEELLFSLMFTSIKLL
jgi:hypothetical protein